MKTAASWLGSATSKPFGNAASGAGVKYLSYWLDLASRLRSWLTSIEIAALERLKRLATSVMVAIPCSRADFAISTRMRA